MPEDLIPSLIFKLKNQLAICITACHLAPSALVLTTACFLLAQCFWQLTMIETDLMEVVQRPLGLALD